MIKNYKVIATKFNNDFVTLLLDSKMIPMEKHIKLKSLFSECTHALVDLADEYENLEEDFDEMKVYLVEILDENDELSEKVHNLEKEKP